MLALHLFFVLSHRRKTHARKSLRRLPLHCTLPPQTKFMKGGTLTMEIKLTLNGKTRKEAAMCIGKAIGEPSVYQRPPTYAYDIGGIILDR